MPRFCQVGFCGEEPLTYLLLCESFVLVVPKEKSSGPDRVFSFGTSVRFLVVLSSMATLLVAHAKETPGRKVYATP